MDQGVAAWVIGLLVSLFGIANAPLAAAAPAPTLAWRAERDVFYLVFVRSFADSNGDHIGDFAGIEQRLGYLQNLGATSIILTPIVPSTTYHNYFTSRFDAVEPAYGDLAAFQRLVAALHRRRPARIAVVNLESPAVRQYFADLFAGWLDPAHDGRFTSGVDGFRIDHMMDDLDHMGRLRHLDRDFWVPLFARARAVNPAITIIAEQADWQYGTDLLQHADVDLVYAFPLRKAIVTLDRQAIAHEIETTQALTPAGKGQLIFIENHDTDRFASLVEGDPRRERIGAALTVLLKGSPLIYYGQELGMQGRQVHGPASDGNDIPVREAFRWTRHVEDPGSATWYRGKESWWTNRHAHDDDGVSVEEQQGRPGSLLEYYRQLLAVRRSHAELQRGGQRVLATDARDLLVVSRELGGRQALLVVNCSADVVSGQIAAADLPGLHGGTLPQDLLGGNRNAAPTAEGLKITMQPYGVSLMELR
jgi:glycosidase